MFKTNPVSLKQLLSAVDGGTLQLPDFQRGWVWDDDRIRGLLASVSRGFPIGAIMTLEAGGEIRLKNRMIEGAEEKAGKWPDAFLLDGQQRLTSLYQSLWHSDAVTPTMIVDDAFDAGTTLTCWPPWIPQLTGRMRLSASQRTRRRQGTSGGKLSETFPARSWNMNST